MTSGHRTLLLRELPPPPPLLQWWGQTAAALVPTSGSRRSHSCPRFPPLPHPCWVGTASISDQFLFSTKPKSSD